jgi:hypothetical protein
MGKMFANEGYLPAGASQSKRSGLTSDAYRQNGRHLAEQGSNRPLTPAFHEEAV